MNTLNLRKQASKLVLAVALATGTAMVAGHIVPDEAHAQRKKKKNKKDKDSGQDVSKEYRAVYTPLNTTYNEGGDISGQTAELAQLRGVTKSPQEQFATGGLLYNAGTRAESLPLRLEGMETMIASGKVPFTAIGQYNYIAFQLSMALEDYDKARKYVQQAMDLNYSDGGITRSDLMLSLANTYFSQDRNAEGLETLERTIAASEQAGQKAPEEWYTFGFSRAYNNDMQAEVFAWSQKRVGAYPSQTNWLDAINVVRQLGEFEDDRELDLLRLVRKAGAMTKSNEFRSFIDAAGDVLSPYPKEVKEVIEEGYALGTLERSDPFITEVYGAVSRRIESDLEELPSYAADARADGASLVDVVTAADTYLTYEDYPKAIEFYTKALGMPGADPVELNMHLGMAQIGAGELDAAKATLAKVTGPASTIADLWTAYAVQESGGPEVAPAAEEDAGPSLEELMGAST